MNWFIFIAVIVVALLLGVYLRGVIFPAPQQKDIPMDIWKDCDLQCKDATAFSICMSNCLYTKTYIVNTTINSIAEQQIALKSF